MVATVSENVGKALSIAYQDKTKLLALHKQVTCGKYTSDSSNDPGFLDVVGNDRKYVDPIYVIQVVLYFTVLTFLLRVGC